AAGGRTRGGGGHGRQGGDPRRRDGAAPARPLGHREGREGRRKRDRQRAAVPAGGHAGRGQARPRPDPERPGQPMSRFFIDRPIVAIVIAILTVILGVVSLVGLPIAQYPSIIPPVIQIQTTYTGADALTIEQSVATPIEQQMNGVEKMLYVQSTNAGDGTMTLNVTFDVESEVNIDQVNAQNRVSQAQPNLPADVSLFGISYRSTVGLPLLVFAIYSPKGTYDSLFLGNYSVINVNDALYRVNGVGQVINFGLSEYAMRIWVKPDKLAKLGLTVPDLVRAVQQQSTVNPSGRIGAEPAPPGQQLTYTVRAQGRLVTAEEFGNVVVRLTPDGSTVRLRDVARIELGALNYNQS